MANPTKRLELREGDGHILRSWIDAGTSRRLVARARILLAASEGTSSRAIADSLGLARATVRLWISRYEREGLGAVARDRARSGRPRKATPEVAERILDRMVNGEPCPGFRAHWTSRLLGEAMGLSHVTVWRVWRAHGLTPDHVRRFEFLRHLGRSKALRDVVGAWLAPPYHAVAFSVDGEALVQELQAASSGRAPGWEASESPDTPPVHRRPDAPGLAEALEAVAGHPDRGVGAARRRHQAFLAFLRRTGGLIEPPLEIHVVVDGHAIHERRSVRSWLEGHPHVRVHFVPTGPSWLNLVEGFLQELQTRRPMGAGELVEALHHYVRHRDRDPWPFLWTRSPGGSSPRTDVGQVLW